MRENIQEDDTFPDLLQTEVQTDKVQLTRKKVNQQELKTFQYQ